MKFYLASSFDLVDRVQKIAEILKEKGHVITCEWWHRDYKKMFIREEDDFWYHHFKVVEISQRNFKGIEKADKFVLIASPETAKSFNGANIELGYALALGKPCYSLGRLQRSAMYVPVVKCEFLDEILREGKP